MFKNIVYLLVFSILIFSCKENVVIDNAIDESIIVNIDKNVYELASNSFKDIEINKGNHKIVSYTKNGDTLLNTIINIESTGIINSSNISYVLWTDIYCEEEDYDIYKTHLDLKDTVIIDGLEFIDIDFKFYDEVFIPKIWDLGLDMPMPDTVDVFEDKNYKILSKIYRPQEIIEYFDYVGDIDFDNLSEEEINSILESMK